MTFTPGTPPVSPSPTRSASERTAASSAVSVVKFPKSVTLLPASTSSSTPCSTAPVMAPVPLVLICDWIAAFISSVVMP